MEGRARARVDWNARAGDYRLVTDRPSTVFALKTMREALGELTTVADIGCGPGNESIPFAAAFRKVYSVDSSPAMLERLRAECAARGISNVETVQSDCLDAELPERCQVAFSCLCPGMFSLDGLRALERLSDDMCVFVGHYYAEGCAERRLLEELGLPVAERFDTALLAERFGAGRDIRTAVFSDFTVDGIDDVVWRCARLCAGGEEDERIVGERVRELGVDAFPHGDDVMVLYWRKNQNRGHPKAGKKGDGRAGRARPSLGNGFRPSCGGGTRPRR